MSIEKNVTDRETFDLIVGEVGPHFWRLAQEKIESLSAEPSEPNREKMSVAESKAFENKKMPFGIHAGEKIGNVPLSLLDHYAGGVLFLRDLNRYLKRVK